MQKTEPDRLLRPASIRESLGKRPSIQEPNIEDGLLTVSDLMLDLRGVGHFGVR